MAAVVRRLRKGMTATAVAAAAMVALTASQAPGVEISGPGQGRSEPSPDGDHPATGNSPYHTELPPLDAPDVPDGPRDPDADTPRGRAEAGIPATVLDAYKKAEKALAKERPGCNLPWQLLAAIGKVESGHASGGAVDADGNTLRPIRGPVLDGNGFALIKDTDKGAFDGDSRYDRAVGPMQFIPSTWAGWGADGNGDGKSDPNNIYDAALAAGRYLCAAGRDLSRPADLERAILSYNRSRQYLNTVLSWLEFYRKGSHEVPDGQGTLPDSPGAGNPS
ncbi:lytic transglycosylase domain-containing protein, partial [Streptomyces alkaliterrae]